MIFGLDATLLAWVWLWGWVCFSGLVWLAALLERQRIRRRLRR